MSICYLWIIWTVVWAGLDVHQWPFTDRQLGRAQAGASPEPLSCPSTWVFILWHFYSWLVILVLKNIGKLLFLVFLLYFYLQVVSNISKSWQTPPACLELAAPWDSMAATLHQHQATQCLKYILWLFWKLIEGVYETLKSEWNINWIC